MKRTNALTKAGKPSRWPTSSSIWCSLTWTLLTRWTGEKTVERGKRYSLDGSVRNLGVDAQGALLADVIGTEEYVTTIRWVGEDLESRCTCPVGERCKHAVAVALAFLNAIADGKSVPTIDGTDPRWDDLREAYDDEEDSAIPTAPSLDLDDLTAAELRDLLKKVAAKNPEVRKSLQDRKLASRGEVRKIVAELRREIRQVTRQPAWSGHWNNYGHIPNYSRVQSLFETLIEREAYDDAIRLGQEFFQAGILQVESSNDEGETAEALGDCMEVVAQAIRLAGVPKAEKLLLVIGFDLLNDYEVLRSEFYDVLAAINDPRAWSHVADHLAAEIKAYRTSGEYDTRPHQLADWLQRALKNSGRDSECLAALEAEALTSRNHRKIVRFHLEKDALEHAERWALEGHAKSLEKLPDIARDLRNALLDIAARRKQWDIVAAHAATDFFQSASARTFDALMKAASAAGCEEAVRATALAYLETGAAPFAIATTKEKTFTVSRDWPLPFPEYLRNELRRNVTRRLGTPQLDVLIEMAMERKDYESAMVWYDRACAENNDRAHLDYSEEIAVAITPSHPERALAYFEKELRESLKPTGNSAYERVVKTLKQMRPAYLAQKREMDWFQRIDAIREQFRNRPKLCQLLIQLQGRTVFESRKTKRR